MGIEAAPGVKYTIIHTMTLRDKNLLNISWLCEIAGFSRSGYYNWVASREFRKQRKAQDRHDLDLILKAYLFRRYRVYFKGIWNRRLVGNNRRSAEDESECRIPSGLGGQSLSLYPLAKVANFSVLYRTRKRFLKKLAVVYLLLDMVLANYSLTCLIDKESIRPNLLNKRKTILKRTNIMNTFKRKEQIAIKSVYICTFFYLWIDSEKHVVVEYIEIIIFNQTIKHLNGFCDQFTASVNDSSEIL